ncbi:MAG: hypothetical protein KTQ49_02210, partial [Candidatus Omnitrophica bacterium]|nr:hypothetical protein [Candidatus Omnitrophota bacterium]
MAIFGEINKDAQFWKLLRYHKLIDLAPVLKDWRKQAFSKRKINEVCARSFRHKALANPSQTTLW